MNKKLFLGMFAAVGALLATSCTNDRLDVVQAGDEAQVTFSLDLEDGLATRAISDGQKADKLVYAVYKLDAQGSPELQNVVGSQKGQFVKTDFVSGYKVSLTLAKGQKYQVAFWAQSNDCKAYDTSDLTAVKVDYKAENGTDGAANNDELRDAFFKTVEFDVSGDKNIDVVLKRPFAQVNVGVYQEDWDAAVASGIEIENSSVIIDNVANTINLLTGAVEGQEEVNYTLCEIPQEPLKVDADGDGEKETYKWLSMSYILVNDTTEQDLDSDATLGDARTTVQSLDYAFAPVSGNVIDFADGLSSVPVQRNWRTNILGKILTGDVYFNITVDPVYDGDIIFPDKSSAAEALELAAAYGGSFTMSEDIAFGEESLVVGGDFIFNMENGATLTSGSASNYGIVVNKGTTEISGEGKIASQGGGIGIINGATVNFNSGELDINTTSTSGRYLFYLEGEGSTLTINGGKFDFNKTQNQKRAYICAMAGTTAYVKGGTFGKASTRSDYKAGIRTFDDGKVIITGGTFGFDPTTWVADGYKAVKNGENWIVVANDVAVAASLNDVKEVFANGGKVVLADDIAWDNMVKIENGKEVVMDMNGKTITFDRDAAFNPGNPIFYPLAGTKLTITGNGTVDLGDNFDAALVYPAGEVVIENGTFIRNRVPAGTDPDDVQTLFMGVKSVGSKLVINGGYFDSGYYDENVELAFSETAADEANRGKSTDKNLIRTAYKNNTSIAFNLSWSSAAGTQDFKIYGGTFANANPAWGDEGCALPVTPDYLRPWSYYQGCFLEGQVMYDDRIEVPAGYTITEGTTADGRPTYTVTYNK